MKKPFFLFRKTAEPDCVPNRRLLSYAFGLAGQNMAYSYVNNWIRYFCINLLHIGEFKVGTIFSLSYIWDAINDPIIGAVVDKRNYKPGQKLRPYLIKFPPIIGALSAMMFFKVNFGENGKICYILLIYFVWDFFYSFQDVALWGMVAASSPLSAERSRVAQWVSIGADAGAGLVGVFQLLRSLLNGFGLSDMQVFVLCGFLFGLGGELISMRAHRVEEKVATEKSDESLWKSFSVLKYNRTLLLISLARFSKGLSPKVQQAYFFENCVSYNIGKTHINGQTAEFAFGLLTYIPGALAVFFATKIAKKAGGMKRVLLLTQVINAVLRIATFFVGYQSLPQMIVTMLIMSVTSIPNSIIDIVHRSLTSDSIDYVEWKTGMRTEGVSFSMQNFTTKMTSGVSNFIEGVLLSRLKYNSRDKAAGIPQNPVFLKWQWPMFVLGPVVGSLLYLFIISFVRDDREKQAQIELELHQRHEKLAEMANGEAIPAANAVE